MNCIGCGAVQERLSGALRCPKCGDLLEISFPGWKAGRGRGLDCVRTQGSLASTADLPL